MTDRERQKLVAILKGSRAGSGEYVKALAEADIRTLAEVLKEIVLKPSSRVVNRVRFESILDHMLKIITRPPTMELAKGDKP